MSRLLAEQLQKALEQDLEVRIRNSSVPGNIIISVDKRDSNLVTMRTQDAMISWDLIRKSKTTFAGKAWGWIVGFNLKQLIHKFNK